MCLKPDHLSCNCTKTKPGPYCKGMHNSAICNDRNKQENQTSTNCASNVLPILLQTTDIVLENPSNKKQVKTKVLFDQGSQRSCVTKRIKNVLGLTAIAQETISISTFMNKTCQNSKLKRVSKNLKGASNFKFSTEALCTPFICLHLKNQPITFAWKNFEFLKDLELADTGCSDDIELLIGSDFYWAFVTGNVRLRKVGEPVGVESKFGWLLNGPVSKEQSVSTNLSFSNENSSHVFFVMLKTQWTIIWTRNYIVFGILKVWEFQNWQKVVLKIFLIRFI